MVSQDAVYASPPMPRERTLFVLLREPALRLERNPAPTPWNRQMVTMSPDDLKVRFDTLLKDYEEALTACRTAHDNGLTGAVEYGRAKDLLSQVEMAGGDLAAALDRALKDTSSAEA